MAKAVLISIRPEWVKKILDGEKTLEVRKTRPKLETPFKCYIYCTAGNLSYEVNNGMMCNISGGRLVVGEFVCDEIAKVNGAALPDVPEFVFYKSCLCFDQLDNYLNGKEGYAWHISNLKVYDIPKQLGEFSPVCRYKNDDKSCPSRKVACSFQRYDYNQDGTINITECGKVIEHPPQSWCYVEELK